MALEKNAVNLMGRQCTNKELYHRISISKAFLADVIRRQMSFMGLILKKDERENIVVTGFIDGKHG